MKTISIVALLATLVAAATPVGAQDLSLSVEAPASSDAPSGPSLEADPGVGLDLSAESAAAIRDLVTAANLPAVDVDFDIAVGVAIPNSVTLSPVSAQMAQLAPALSGYLYFVLTDGRIVVVSPSTLEIVLVIYG